MGRPRPEDYEDRQERRPPRQDYREDFVDDVDEPEFEEPEERRPRQKSTKKPSHRPAREEEEDMEEEEEEDDARYKQVAVRRKPSKSKGKELARRKSRREPSEDEEDEEDSEEEDKKQKKKAQKKQKRREAEMIVKSAWEPVPRDELDMDFVFLVSEELGHDPDKILEGVEEEMVQRHTETGEYNIAAFFEQGYFSKRDEKKWKSAVAKLKRNKEKSRVLYCSTIAEPNGGGYGYMTRPQRVPMPVAYYPPPPPPPPAPARGHRRYDPYCPHCEDFGMPCGAAFSGY